MDGRRPLPSWLTHEELEDRINKAVEATDAILESKGLPTMDDYAKAAKKAANKLAKGGHSKFGKRKLVSEWAKNMKAMIKAGKK
jgi:ElaB/YqjD/DUF883 family membrane-anchored ribosome-binding protein